MHPTRRGFLKAGTGAVVASVLGFDVKTRLRSGAGTEDRPNHGDALHVSVLLGELRRHHPHPRRQGQERHRAGGARGRRSGSSHQSRHALSQGLVADAGHPERPARAQAASAAARAPIIGKTSPGSRPTTRWRVTSRRRATRLSSPPTPQGRTVNRLESIAWNGGCTDTNEFNFLAVKTMRSLGVTFIENQARV